MPVHNLTLYSRRGCHLCEDMLAQLDDLTEEYDFALTVRDVDENRRWAEEFGEQVPILFADNIEVCRYFLDLVAVRRLLNPSSADSDRQSNPSI